jgi:hypothetical protein
MSIGNVIKSSPQDLWMGGEMADAVTKLTLTPEMLEKGRDALDCYSIDCGIAAWDAAVEDIIRAVLSAAGCALQIDGAWPPDR